MQFKNTNNIDVYVDLGRLRRVVPGEVIDLPGAITCPGLTLIHEGNAKKSQPVKKAPVKKRTKSTKNVDTSGTI